MQRVKEEGFVKILISNVVLFFLFIQNLYAEGGATHGEGAHEAAHNFASTFPYWINFVIYVLLVLILLKKKFPPFWLSRATRIKEEVAQGLRELSEAKALLAAEEKKIAGLAADKKEVRERIATDTVREKAQIIAEAEAKASRVVAQAHELAALEKRNAQTGLRAEIAERAIHLAEQLVTKEGDPALDKAYQNAALDAIHSMER